MSRHPNFKEHGGVSIIAHSLGSVIVYDILERYDMKVRDLESSTQSRFVTDSLNYLNSMEECRDADSSAAAGSGARGNPIQVELAETQRRLEQLDHQLQQQLDKSGECCGSFALRFKVMFTWVATTLFQQVSCSNYYVETSVNPIEGTCL